MMRLYMRNFRLAHKMSYNEMAARCGCSVALLRMIEADDQEVTHPNIAKRIAKAYRLTPEQYESILPKNYRPNDPDYDPYKYVVYSAYEDIGEMHRLMKGENVDDEPRMDIEEVE